jgi:YVTN family beta-propeller protein
LIDPSILQIVRTVTLEDVPKAAQIARYSPDGSVLLVTSLQSGTATLIDASFSRQATLTVGKQPMDGTFRDGRLFVACQGDGSIHVIDVAARKVAHSFAAGTGCETLGFF